MCSLGPFLLVKSHMHVNIKLHILAMVFTDYKMTTTLCMYSDIK